VGRCPFHNDRRYCVRGPQKNLSPEFMKVNLLVSRQEEFHPGTLDLQTDRQRAAFIKRAAEELHVKEEAIRKDVGRVFLNACKPNRSAKRSNPPSPKSSSATTSASKRWRCSTRT